MRRTHNAVPANARALEGVGLREGFPADVQPYLCVGLGVVGGAAYAHVCKRMCVCVYICVHICVNVCMRTCGHLRMMGVTGCSCLPVCAVALRASGLSRLCCCLSPVGDVSGSGFSSPLSLPDVSGRSVSASVPPPPPLPWP